MSENIDVTEELSEEQSETDPPAAEAPAKPLDKKKLLSPKQRKLRLLKKILILHIGIILMSCSVYFFQTPNNFTLGGVAGIAILLSNVIQHPFFTQSVLMLIINVFLIIIGLIILGKQCTFLTIYCSLFYTGIIALLELVLPLSAPITNQPFMELCYAVLLFGVGGALIFNCGASSGGTDIIALIVKKFTKLNVGKALLFTDFIVAASTFFIFGIQTGLFSVLGLFAKAFLVDGVIESIGKSKYLQIITSKPEEITPFILEGLHRGVTSFKATGGYTGEEKTVILAVCKRGEAIKIKAKITAVDPKAFVIITDSNEIIGKGFRSV